jgi:hypothetical protein
MADHDIGKDNRSGPNEYIALDPNPSKLLEMSHDRCSDADRSAIFDGDEVRPRRIQHYVVSDPDALSNFDTPGALQKHAEGASARGHSGESLKNAAPHSPKQRFFRFPPITSNLLRIHFEADLVTLMATAGGMPVGKLLSGEREFASVRLGQNTRVIDDKTRRG